MAKKSRGRQFRLLKCGFNQCWGWKARGCFSMSLKMCSCTPKTHTAPIRLWLLWFTSSKSTSSKVSASPWHVIHNAIYKFPQLHLERVVAKWWIKRMSECCFIADWESIIWGCPVEQLLWRYWVEMVNRPNGPKWTGWHWLYSQLSLLAC